jgi:CheY-like chemotaxis protein
MFIRSAVVGDSMTQVDDVQGGRHLVLLAEDSEDDTLLCKRVFSKACDQLDFIRARDGAELLDILNDHKARQVPLPSVVLLDIKMPGMTGLEALERLRRDPAFSQIIVVILSASNRSDDVQKAFQLGANCYLVKPPVLSDYNELARTFCAFWFGHSQLPPGPPLTSGTA